MLPDLTVVMGGAASGKSDFAEHLLGAADLHRVYIATAQAWDDEMRVKIAAHRRTRAHAGWNTVETPFDPGAAIAGAPHGHGILLDCATMWLSNHLLAENDLSQAEADLMAGLDAARGPVMIVTNEVGGGIVPDNALARQFRQAQGGFNRRLAARADLVIAVMAGLPLVLKGQMP